MYTALWVKILQIYTCNPFLSSFFFFLLILPHNVLSFLLLKSISCCPLVLGSQLTFKVIRNKKKLSFIPLLLLFLFCLFCFVMFYSDPSLWLSYFFCLKSTLNIPYLILHFSWKDIFFRYWILGWQLYFFSDFNDKTTSFSWVVCFP